MKLVPSDLGASFAAPLYKRRGAPQQRVPVGAYGGAVGLATGITATMISQGVHVVFAVASGLIGGGVARIAMAKLIRRNAVEAPLTVGELASLRQPKTIGPSVLEQIASTLLGHPLPPTPSQRTLEDAYLDLVEAALTTEVSDAAQEAELRGTMRSLGESVAALPAPAPLDETEIADLVVSAEGMLFRAKRESDSVIAASLNRQAEATVRRARALQEATKIARRTKTLRQEVLAQVEAVRASLPLYGQTQQVVASGRLHVLAESVRSVAQEAASVSAAQAELLEALDPPIVAQATTDEPETNYLRVRR